MERNNEVLGHLETARMLVQFFLNMANNQMGGIKFLEEQILFEYPDLARWNNKHHPVKCMAIDVRKGDIPKELVGFQLRIVPPNCVDMDELSEILFDEEGEPKAKEPAKDPLDEAMKEALKKAGYKGD